MADITVVASAIVVTGTIPAPTIPDTSDFIFHPDSIEVTGTMGTPTVDVSHARQLPLVGKFIETPGRLADPQGLTNPVLSHDGLAPAWEEQVVPPEILEVKEVDNSPDVTPVNVIVLGAGLVLTDDGGGQVTITPTAHTVQDYVLMTSGVTDPPEPVWDSETGEDWLYGN
jgi:hypothetical protein